MIVRTTLVFLIALFLANSAVAAILPETFTLSTLVGGHIFAADQHYQPTLLRSFGIGYNLTDRAALEAVFTRTDPDGRGSTSDAVVKTYRVDALYHFRPNRSLVPFLAAGFGEIIIDPDVDKRRDHWLTAIGGGLKYFLGNRVALRADLRCLFDFPKPEINLLYSAGLEFQLGQSASPPAPKP